LTRPARNILAVGTTFTVNVLINSDQPVKGAQAAVEFNKNVLSVVSTTNKGKLFGDYVVANGGTTEDNIVTSPSGSITNANTNGYTADLGVAIVDMPALPGPTPDGAIFWTLTFQAIAEGDSDLNLLNGTIADSDGTVIDTATFTSGHVHVGAVTAPDYVLPR
jgi:hypothetical protein